MPNVNSNYQVMVRFRVPLADGQVALTNDKFVEHHTSN